MRALLLTSLIFINTAFAQDSLLEDVRKNIRDVFTISETCFSIYNQFETTDVSSNPLLLGYKGAVELGMARHATNPFKKMSYFSSGKEHLEEAIAKDTSDVELRFLRLTIQVNLPSFLGYSDDIESDHKFVLANLGDTEDQFFINRVNGFLADAKKRGKL